MNFLYNILNYCRSRRFDGLKNKKSEISDSGISNPNVNSFVEDLLISDLRKFRYNNTGKDIRKRYYNFFTDKSFTFTENDFATIDDLCLTNILLNWEKENNENIHDWKYSFTILKNDDSRVFRFKRYDLNPSEKEILSNYKIIYSFCHRSLSPSLSP